MSERCATQHLRQRFWRREVIEDGFEHPENLTFLNLPAAHFFSLDDGRTYAYANKSC